MYGRLRARRRGAAGPGGPVRVGRRRPRVPRLHEPVALRAERLAGAHRRGRAHRAGARGGREGLPHRAHRGDGLRAPSRRRALPLPVRVRAVPARAAGVAAWCGACSTAGAGSWSPTTASRCTTTATPRTSRTRCCSRSSSPTPPPGRSSTSATRRCSASARSWRSSPPRSVTSSRSCRCPTTSPCRPDRSSRSRCPRIGCSTSPACAATSGTATSCPPARRWRAPRTGWRRTRSSAGAQEERVLTDPFDYEAEDRLIDAWHAARASLPSIAFDAGAGVRHGVQRPRWATPHGDRLRRVSVHTTMGHRAPCGAHGVPRHTGRIRSPSPASPAAVFAPLALTRRRSGPPRPRACSTPVAGTSRSA